MLVKPSRWRSRAMKWRYLLQSRHVRIQLVDREYKGKEVGAKCDICNDCGRPQGSGFLKVCQNEADESMNNTLQSWGIVAVLVVTEHMRLCGLVITVRISLNRSIAYTCETGTGSATLDEKKPQRYAGGIELRDGGRLCSASRINFFKIFIRLLVRAREHKLEYSRRTLSGIEVQPPTNMMPNRVGIR